VKRSDGKNGAEAEKLGVEWCIRHSIIDIVEFVSKEK